MIRTALTTAALAAFFLAGCAASCNPPPQPQPPGPAGGAGPVPVPSDGGVGGASSSDPLVVAACANAQTRCGAPFAECLRQIDQLRNSPNYATLSDATLRAWASADSAQLKGSGVCR